MLFQIPADGMISDIFWVLPLSWGVEGQVQIKQVNNNNERTTQAAAPDRQ